jgi:hypothetical protein
MWKIDTCRQWLKRKSLNIYNVTAPGVKPGAYKGDMETIVIALVIGWLIFMYMTWEIFYK